MEGMANVFHRWSKLAEHGEQNEVHAMVRDIGDFLVQSTGRSLTVLGLADGRWRAMFSRMCGDDTRYLTVLVRDPAIHEHNNRLRENVDLLRTAMKVAANHGNQEEVNIVTRLAAEVQDMKNDWTKSGQAFKAKMAELETFISSKTDAAKLRMVAQAARKFREAEWDYDHREASVFSLLCSCSGSMIWQPDTGDFYLAGRLIWNGQKEAGVTSCVEVFEDGGWQPIYPTLNRQMVNYFSPPCVSQLFEVVDWNFGVRIRGVVFELVLIQKHFHLLDCWVALLLPHVRRNCWRFSGARDRIPKLSNAPKRKCLW